MNIHKNLIVLMKAAQHYQKLTLISISVFSCKIDLTVTDCV